MPAQRKEPLTVELEAKTFSRLMLAGGASEAVTIKLSIKCDHFGNGEYKWESFIVNLEDLPVLDFKDKNLLACKGKWLKIGHWDGEFFTLKALKIELAKNDAGHEYFSMPDLIIF